MRDQTNDSPNLREVECVVNEAGNYGLLTDEEIVRINKLLGWEVISTYGDIDGRRLQEFSLLELKRLRFEIEQLLIEMKGRPEYEQALAAYRFGDQKGLRQYIPQIFSHVEPCPTPPEILYHGVTLPEGQSIDDYLDLVLKIKREGLKASPYGIHAGMDRYIQPIFTVYDPEYTHGLIYFGLNPKEEDLTVFKPNLEAERTLYTPRFGGYLEIHLKSSQYFEQGVLIDGVRHLDPEEFHLQLQERMGQRGVDFILSDPTGTIAKDGLDPDLKKLWSD